MKIRILKCILKYIKTYIKILKFSQNNIQVCSVIKRKTYLLIIQYQFKIKRFCDLSCDFFWNIWSFWCCTVWRHFNFFTLRWLDFSFDLFFLFDWSITLSVLYTQKLKEKGWNPKLPPSKKFVPKYKRSTYLP